MAKSIKRNYIYNLFQQLLTIFTPLVTTPYVSRVIGAKGIGVYSYANSIVTYFALLAAFGIFTYGKREISYCQDNRKKRTKVFWNIEFLCIITTFISLCLYIIFFSFQKENLIIYAILTLSIIDVFLNIDWFFSGMEEFGKIVFRNSVIKILGIIFILIFVKGQNALIIYILGLCIFACLADLSFWFVLPKYIDKPSFKDIKPLNDIKTVFSFFVPTIAISIYTVLDKTMIGVITKNAAENGFYEQAMKFVRITLMLVTSLGTVMLPRIGYYFEKKDTEKINYYTYKSYRFTTMLAFPIFLGCIAISSNFVPWFFGKGFDEVIPLIKILSFILVPIGLSSITGNQYLIPTKRQNVVTKTVLIGALCNFIFNIILIQFLGAIGAGISSVIAETVIAVIQLIIVRKEISIVVIIKNLLKYVIASVIMFIVVFLFSVKLSPSVINTFMLIFIGIVIYMTSLLLLKDDLFIENVNIILNKLRRSK